MSLLEAVVGLGDDALVLGQRLSAWCGKSPWLEEDLAVANTALDFLGRARLLYGYAEQLDGCDEDAYAFQRDAQAFTNLLIYELPCADFASSCARQFLVDVFDAIHLERLSESADAELAGIAAKAHKEALVPPPSVRGLASAARRWHRGEPLPHAKGAGGRLGLSR